MTITREQVADLRAGDVVEMTDDHLCTARGPLREAWPSGGLQLGSLTMVRYGDGRVPQPTWSLTVVSHAPRPLYVNHDRTEPVAGDVVRDADTNSARTWLYRAGGSCPWLHVRGTADVVWGSATRECLPARLRLLVDGETGQVVP